MGKYLVLLFFSFLIFSNPISALETKNKKTHKMNRKHQIGIRLGGWINGGESPPALLTDTFNNPLMKTSIKDGSFYFEGYYAYNLLPYTFMEFSLGIVNRGSVTIYDIYGTDIGNLLIYPILLQVKLYPLLSSDSKLQPFVGFGGGLYYGRRNVQFTNNSYSFYSLNEDSKTDFNYTLSGGVDWCLNNSIAFDMQLKYMPINFSKSLVTVNDFKAVSVTVGIKYLYATKK